MPPKIVKLTLRMSEDAAAQIAEAARIKGYSSPTAFIRAAIEHELSDRSELSDAEQRIASSFDRLSRNVFRVGRGQQALFALLDTLTRRSSRASRNQLRMQEASDRTRERAV